MNRNQLVSGDRRSLAVSARPSLSKEQGSAYIVTLLVLFVLTALGLSLALITSTESTMGSQERTIQRTFYAADSGLSLALASVLSNNGCEAKCVFLEDDATVQHGLLDQIEVTKMAVVSDQASNLSQINDSRYRNFNYYVASRAARIARGADDIPIAQRTVSQMFALDPWVTPGVCVTDFFVPCSTTSSLITIPPP